MAMQSHTLWQTLWLNSLVLRFCIHHLTAIFSPLLIFLISSIQQDEIDHKRWTSLSSTYFYKQIVNAQEHDKYLPKKKLNEIANDWIFLLEKKKIMHEIGIRKKKNISQSHLFDLVSREHECHSNASLTENKQI